MSYSDKRSSRIADKLRSSLKITGITVGCVSTVGVIAIGIGAFHASDGYGDDPYLTVQTENRLVRSISKEYDGVRTVRFNKTAKNDDKNVISAVINDSCKVSWTPSTKKSSALHRMLKPSDYELKEKWTGDEYTAGWLCGDMGSGVQKRDEILKKPFTERHQDHSFSTAGLDLV